MPKKSITSSAIKVDIFKGSSFIAFNKRRVIKLVKKTSRLFGLRKAQINIEIADDKRIVAVNKSFLKRSSITDVISFDTSEDGEKNFDIVVNAQLAQRQAETRGHSSEAELTLYIIHGLLHQLGFDDMTSRKAAKMHRTEDEILRKAGFGVVYGSDKR